MLYCVKNILNIILCEYLQYKMIVFFFLLNNICSIRWLLFTKDEDLIIVKEPSWIMALSYLYWRILEGFQKKKTFEGCVKVDNIAQFEVCLSHITRLMCFVSLIILIGIVENFDILF